MMAALVPRLEVVVFLRDSAGAQKSSVDVVVGRHSRTLEGFCLQPRERSAPTRRRCESSTIAVFVPGTTATSCRTIEDAGAVKLS